MIAATQGAIAAAQPSSLDAVRQAGALVLFSEDMRQQSQELKHFLLHKLYRHPQVMQTTLQAKRIVAELFEAYMEAPHEMQAGFTAKVEAITAPEVLSADVIRARVVADYIAGMTDRFAVREHARLTGTQLLLQP